MSAFVVDDTTISKILNFINYDFKGVLPSYFLKQQGIDRHDLSSLEHFGRKLLAMNEAAVDARYSQHESDGAPYYKLDLSYTAYESDIEELANIYKAASCLLYQCSEGDVPEWPLYKFLEKLKEGIGRALIQSLPEYEAAPWG